MAVSRQGVSAACSFSSSSSSLAAEVLSKACLGAQAFSAWIHICAVRLFVESILRYGLPPKFLAALMKPHQKTTPKLRKLLAQLFGSQGDLVLLLIPHLHARSVELSGLLMGPQQAIALWQYQHHSVMVISDVSTTLTRGI